MKTLTTFCLVLALGAGMGFAQLPGCDNGSLAADLTLNGMAPDEHSSTIGIGMGNPLVIDVNSTANGRPVVLLAGAFVQCGFFPTPWGGSIDVAGATVLVDGFGMTAGFFDQFAVTPFNMQMSVPPTANGLLGALQAVVATPGGGAPFDNSVAINVTIDPTRTTSYTLPDDNFVLHPLLVAVEFGDVIYTEAFINSNGYITFEAGSTDFSETMGEFFNGWNNAPNPGVAVYYSDLNRNGTTSGATYDVVENFNNSEVEFQFNNQIHWSSSEPAGSFSAIFNEDPGFGDVRLDYSNFMPGTTATDGGIIGVSDGDNTVGMDVDLSDGLGTGIASQIGVYSSAAGVMESIGELIPANTAIGFTTVRFFELFGTHRYDIIP